MFATARCCSLRASSSSLRSLRPSPAALRPAATQQQRRHESSRTHPALLKDPPAGNPSAATDPWGLQPPPPPPAPSVNAPKLSMDELLATPHPEGRDAEETEILRKRLVYESRKRGILEMDLILATFAQERLSGMSDRELREYDRFLTLPDWSIYYYATAKAEAPEPWASSWVLGELIEHAVNRGRQVRSMPALEDQK